MKIWGQSENALCRSGIFTLTPNMPQGVYQMGEV